VFAGEKGARLHTSVPGHDVDEFDEHCDHLVVRDDRTGRSSAATHAVAGACQGS